MARDTRVLAPQPVADLQEYIAGGGGRAIKMARKREPVSIIADIEASGLRGRGGAGFPTGRKWRTVCVYESGAIEPPTVVVNGAEGEPGSFKDRAILERDPYRVLEGALVAAHAIGADTVVVALRRSFDEVRDRVERAAAELRAAGWLEHLDLQIVSGPEEYLFGEETALLEVLDGRDPFPRIAPPYRRGVDEIEDPNTDAHGSTRSAAGIELAGPTPENVAPPTLVDNVETIANVPGIVSEGVDWFRSLGSEASPGTLVCTITGATARAGVGEVAMGTSLREVIDRIGGGPRPGRTVRGVLTGVSNAVVTEAQLDTPLTYEAMDAIGAGLGCGAFIVFDDEADFVAIAAGVARFLAVESCGQCTPCKQDGLALAELLDAVCRSDADEHTLESIDDRLTTVADSARCNLASQYQLVLRSILDQHGDQVAAHAEGRAGPVDPEVIAPIERLERGEAVLDSSHVDKQPDWTYEEAWSGQSPADRLARPHPGEDR